jgi:hypothetical protein
MQKKKAKVLLHSTYCPHFQINCAFRDLQKYTNKHVKSNKSLCPESDKIPVETVNRLVMECKLPHFVSPLNALCKQLGVLHLAVCCDMRHICSRLCVGWSSGFVFILYQISESGRQQKYFGTPEASSCSHRLIAKPLLKQRLRVSKRLSVDIVKTSLSVWS